MRKLKARCGGKFVVSGELPTAEIKDAKYDVDRI
jgi:hypothetical protein